MTTAVLPEIESARRKVIAPWRHTALLLVIFILMAAGGAVLHYRAKGLVYYVWKGGLRRSGVGLLEFTGGSWKNIRSVVNDMFLAFSLWMLVFAEAVLWILLSISAGIPEELVFRGYLQRQLTAFTGRVWLALVLQAAVFAVAHGYQGVTSCLAIAIYGALFTVIALWRKSLRPGMIAHAGTDIAAGLLR